MDDSSRIDYQRAAERLLVALSFIAKKLPNKPVPAVALCSHIFDAKTRKPWSRETRRRRVRDVVELARCFIRERHTIEVAVANGGSRYDQQMQIVGSGQGYLMTGDAQTISWYAYQRRRRGLAELAAGSQVKRDLATAGQRPLFPPKPAGDGSCSDQAEWMEDSHREKS